MVIVSAAIAVYNPCPYFSVGHNSPQPMLLVSAAIAVHNPSPYFFAIHNSPQPMFLVSAAIAVCNPSPYFSNNHNSLQTPTHPLCRSRHPPMPFVFHRHPQFSAIPSISLSLCLQSQAAFFVSHFSQQSHFAVHNLGHLFYASHYILQSQSCLSASHYIPSANPASPLTQQLHPVMRVPSLSLPLHFATQVSCLCQPLHPVIAAPLFPSCHNL